ncbi:MAG: hypothetical protein ACD_12C00035G0002 [uncultured bacterium]|nr:MAG: hypothetical protein ACD_12C00035G0002 [uncultured bacterium]
MQNKYLFLTIIITGLIVLPPIFARFISASNQILVTIASLQLIALTPFLFLTPVLFVLTIISLFKKNWKRACAFALLTCLPMFIFFIISITNDIGFQAVMGI